MSAVEPLSPSQLVTALEQVIGGQYNLRPMFFWESSVDSLRALLSGHPEVNNATQWLDVSVLAEDVIPRSARERLNSRLVEYLDRVTASRRSVLAVTNPYLLLKYLPSSPFGVFWSRFVTSSRAVVVVLPRPVPRPTALPDYVKFRADAPRQLFVAPPEEWRVVSADGGTERW